MSDKNLPPTERKRRQAALEGQAPRSKILTASTAVVIAVTVIASTSTALSRRMIDWATHLLSLREINVDRSIGEALSLLARATLPVCGAVMIFSAFVAAASTGVQFNFTHVMPQAKRLDVAAGIQRMFSFRNLGELLKTCAFALILGAFGVMLLSDRIGDFIKSVMFDRNFSFGVTLKIVGPIVTKIAWLFVTLGVFDYALVRRRHEKELMMSHDEIKQEHKNSEGDPHTKGKRKQMHKQLARGGPARGVQKATAVVVNPTHIAIALRFDELECDAPYIVAMGRDDVALALRREATALNIPIVRDIPLARALIHFDLGNEIPEELYEAAAAVLAAALDASEINAEQSGRNAS